MQVGEEDLALSQQTTFGQLRLLDLHDHVGALEHAGGIGDDRRSGGGVPLVVQPDLHSGAGLHHHAVSMVNQFTDRPRRQAHPVLVVLDLLRNANQHRNLRPPGMAHREMTVSPPSRIRPSVT